MRRLACLLLSLTLATSLCAASDAGTVAPHADAAGDARCSGKTSQANVATDAAPSDAPARVEAAAPRPGTASRGGLRSANPRWHRLLPGMFR